MDYDDESMSSEDKKTPTSPIRMYFDHSVSTYYCPKHPDHSPLIKLDSNYKIISSDDNSVDDLTKMAHLSVIGFYKCIGIEKSTGKLTPCQYSTDIRSDFTQHVRRFHNYLNLICVYCTDMDNFQQVKHFSTAILLVIHMEKIHPNLFYQCNLCQYRSLTPDHVNIHQLTRHRQQLKTFIIRCPRPLFNTDLTLKQFYDEHRVDNQQRQSNYQCLYCYKDFLKQNFHGLIVHLVKMHPDFPIMFYLPDEVSDDLMNLKLCSDNTEIIELTDDESMNGDNLIHCLSPEDLLTDDEDSENINPNKSVSEPKADNQVFNYCCFFCPKRFDTTDSIKMHSILHLFDSLNLNIRDPFFDNWIDWFIGSQHSYDNLSNSLKPDDDRNGCPICIKLSPFSQNEQNKKILMLSKQKIHYIQHSGYKPFKCLLCKEERNDEFWLPEIHHLIIQHLNDFHRKNKTECQSLKSFNLTKPKIKDWTPIKEILCREGFLQEYSTRNRTFFDSLSKENQNALKILETAYQSHFEQNKTKL